jgi:hypothetical protein
VARYSVVMGLCSVCFWGCGSGQEEHEQVRPVLLNMSRPEEVSPEHEEISDLAMQFVLTPRTEQASLLCPEDLSARTPGLLERLPPERRVPVEVEEDEVSTQVSKLEILPDGALVYVRFGGGVGNTLRDVVRIRTGPTGDCVVHGFMQHAALADAMSEARSLEEEQLRIEAIAVLMEATSRVDDARVVNFDLETRYGQVMEDLARMVSDQAETLRTRDYDFQGALDLLAETIALLDEQRLRWRELGEDLGEVTERLQRIEERQRNLRALRTAHLGGRWTWTAGQADSSLEVDYLASLESVFEPEIGTSRGYLYSRCMDQKIQLMVSVSGDERLLTESIYGGRSDIVIADYAIGDERTVDERVGSSDWGTAPIPGTDGTSAFLSPDWIQTLLDIDGSPLIFRFYSAGNQTPILLEFDTTASRAAIEKMREHCDP